MGFPSSTISPASGVSNPARQRASVDFPDPDLPSTATVEPAGNERSIPSSDCIANSLRDSMRFCTNLLLSPRTSSSASHSVSLVLYVRRSPDSSQEIESLAHTHLGSPAMHPSCRARLLHLHA